MGKFKSFILDESKTNPLGLLNFEIELGGKILGTILAKDKKSALNKAWFKYFEKIGTSGNENIKAKLIKEN